MKKQTIGFDRQLALSWLDLTAGLAQQEFDQSQIRQKLLARLADEIFGAEACKKTTTVLTRIWVRVPAEHQALQTEALTLLPVVLPEERLWAHWGMSTLAYPFFYDVASIVGRLLRLQGEFELKQIRRRMRESWGQRTTLDRAIRRVLQTFVAWGVIQQTNSKEGRAYQISPIRQTDNSALAIWFIECVIQATRQATDQADRQLPLADLIQSPAVFPFDLAPHMVTLHRSARFEISRQGLDLEMVAPV